VIEDESDRADSLMFQLQAIFANLMDSDDASYDAAGFCAAYKDYGQSTAHAHTQTECGMHWLLTVWAR